MATTPTRRRSGSHGGGFQRTRPAAPADPTARRLVVTLDGDAPFWLSDDESYAMWRARDEDGGQVVVRGALGRCAAGEMLSCEGRWQEHRQHGWSFQVSAYQSALPTTTDGIERWLQTRVHGVGPTFARAITTRFGVKAFEAIDADPSVLFDLTTAKGAKMPRAQVEGVVAAWGEAKHLRQVESFLFAHGITASLADKLFRRFGEDVVEVLRTDPYQATQIRGVGFRIADQIAQNLGIAPNDPKRVRASIDYVLEEAESDGHVFLSLEQFHHRTVDALKISDPALVAEQAREAAGAGDIVVEQDDTVSQRVYRRRTWETERRLARYVRQLLDSPAVPLLQRLTRPVLPEGMSEQDARAAHLYVPTDDQWAAVEMASSARLSLLTGGPGVGKTASQDMTLHAAVAEGKQVLLCAPTGKAARRLTEVTGQPATTIHRMLAWSPMYGEFEHGPDNPLEADLVICDEASMLSLDLAEALVGAIGPRTHLLLVGDPDQLPPVGCGKVLADLIESAEVPRTHLNEIFRQAAGSMIITNAHRINHGQIPYLRQEEAVTDTGRADMLRDFFWVGRDSPEKTAALAVEFAAERIPNTFGMDPAQEIMVLAPMRKGACGLEVLNTALQAKLNPAGRPIGVKNIRVGDRIIQNQNDYTHGREIMNGELAIVDRFDPNNGDVTMTLDDGRQLVIPAADMDTFTLAWAISVHKFQGSQHRAIVFCVSAAHYTMLTRSLIYTAVTRAQQLCVVVGERKALQMSVQRVDARRRNSSLVLRIAHPEESGELF